MYADMIARELDGQCLKSAGSHLQYYWMISPDLRSSHDVVPPFDLGSNP
jgi:hypothetical protein